MQVNCYNKAMAVPLTKDEIIEFLNELNEWEYSEDGFLFKDFVFKDFDEAMAFINAVAAIAKELNHHPDMELHTYRHVTITLTTHDVEGLTKKDFEVASRIDALSF